MTNNNHPQGQYNAEFNANILNAGIYYVVLQTATKMITQKIIVTK
ncbi:MAG: T9SS type A sorting domain-containing protein [Saprospiraceae bacterium]